MEINPSLNATETTSLLTEYSQHHLYQKPKKQFNHLNGMLLIKYYEEFTEIKNRMDNLPASPLSVREIVVYASGLCAGAANLLFAPLTLYLSYKNFTETSRFYFIQNIAYDIINNMTASSEGWFKSDWTSFVSKLENYYNSPKDLVPQFCVDQKGTEPFYVRYPEEWKVAGTIFAFSLLLIQSLSLSVPLGLRKYSSKRLPSDLVKKIERHIKFYEKILDHRHNLNFNPDPSLFTEAIMWKEIVKLPYDIQKLIAKQATKEVLPTEPKTNHALKKCRAWLINHNMHASKIMLYRSIILVHLFTTAMMYKWGLGIIQDMYNGVDYSDNTFSRFFDSRHCDTRPCTLYGFIGDSHLPNKYSEFGGFNAHSIPDADIHSDRNYPYDPDPDTFLTYAYWGLGMTFLPIAVMGLNGLAEKTSRWAQAAWKHFHPAEDP